MNIRQVLRQVRYQLANRVWTGGSTAIFPVGAVVVSNFPVEVLIARIGRLPFAAIRLLTGQIDPEHRQSSDILRYDVAVTVAVGVEGDLKGEDPLLGSHRVSATSSDGKGLLEVQAEVLDEIGLMNRIEGVSLQYLADTIPEPQVVDGDPSVVYCDYVHQAWVVRQSFYHPATGFEAADGGSGTASLTWKVPADRFDRLSMILRRASGSTAPTSATGGTGVTLASALAESVTDSPGVGTWSYALFAAYDEVLEVGESGRSANQYSASRTQTVVVT